MTEAWSAAAEAIDGGRHDEAFIVDVDGFAGPLDVLLDLARRQKVDLKQISIVRLAEQYLTFIAALQRTSLQVAAEYLVMAAWLAYLKSRLLLPEPASADEPDAEELAAALAYQLRRLDAMRTAGARLMAVPQLGDAFFLRPPQPAADAGPDAPAPTVITGAVGLHDLLRAFADVVARRRCQSPLSIAPMPLATIEDALARLRAGIGHAPDWETLSRYLPEGTLDGLRQGDLAARSELAVTVVAALELARQGVIALRQGQPFGPILLRQLGRIE